MPHSSRERETWMRRGWMPALRLHRLSEDAPTEEIALNALIAAWKPITRAALRARSPGPEVRLVVQPPDLILDIRRRSVPRARRR